MGSGGQSWPWGRRGGAGVVLGPGCSVVQGDSGRRGTSRRVGRRVADLDAQDHGEGVCRKLEPSATPVSSTACTTYPSLSSVLGMARGGSERSCIQGVVAVYERALSTRFVARPKPDLQSDRKRPDAPLIDAQGGALAAEHTLFHLVPRQAELEAKWRQAVAGLKELAPHRFFVTSVVCLRGLAAPWPKLRDLLPARWHTPSATEARADASGARPPRRASCRSWRAQRGWPRWRA